MSIFLTDMALNTLFSIERVLFMVLRHGFHVENSGKWKLVVVSPLYWPVLLNSQSNNPNQDEGVSELDVECSNHTLLELLKEREDAILRLESDVTKVSNSCHRRVFVKIVLVVVHLNFLFLVQISLKLTCVFILFLAVGAEVSWGVYVETVLCGANVDKVSFVSTFLLHSNKVEFWAPTLTRFVWSVHFL